MPGQGHAVNEDEGVDAEPYERVVHLTLRDGFESWYWIDTRTCRVTRKRDFRAFHPDVDSTQSWIETRFSDFREAQGVSRAWTVRSIDLATGDTISDTRLLDARGSRTAGSQR